MSIKRSEFAIRILLVHPPRTVPERLTELFWGPPLGLAYLAAVAARDGHEVSILDAVGLYPVPLEEGRGAFRYGMEPHRILERVREFEPELMGINCPYATVQGDALDLARLVKERYSADVPVVMGGAHASVATADLLADPRVDMVVVGEGEVTFSELCRAIESGGPIPDVDGVLRMRDGAPAGNARRDRILDLDSLPAPRRDLLPMDTYDRIDSAGARINDMRHPKTSMLTSRGCPNDCIFCSIRCVWGPRWVARSPEAVVDEIESLVDGYGMRELYFLDDSMTSSRKRMKRICELIIDRGVDIRWVPSSGVTIKSLDEELLRLMKRSGCYRLSFGLESGDPEVLSFIRKDYTYEQARRVIDYANRIGLWTVATFIVGMPFETREQMERTARYAIESGVDFASIFCAAPYQGTDLYDVYVRAGLEPPPDASLVKGVTSTCMSAEEINAFRNAALKRFFRNRMLRPWKPLAKIRSLEDLRYVARVAGLMILKALYVKRSKPPVKPAERSATPG
ncbi:MAG: B12-binding domain-containing radical SAM protein [Actinobacteria bacterium]|nr:B12-binding domain-containing radical SAM protein [Actinomycetota bacterium]MBU1944244.1 B12-binding domain-containing radical SAM protein [Actinomycetota bacterium]MBU2688015.1 B12-binding domain-containing radical SAM protein [Actinomycetota bacterium]